MLKLTDVDDSDFYLVKVEKDYFTKKELTVMGYIVKIGNKISFKRSLTFAYHSGKLFNMFDEIKIERKIKELKRKMVSLWN